MEWGDFEHLIRELFEKEFASRGGEVKVTQASSDGGSMLSFSIQIRSQAAKS
jgi:hypothetical protein